MSISTSDSEAPQTPGRLPDHRILTELSRFFSSHQPAFLVGGYLRDSLLGIPSKDLDIAVPGDPAPLALGLAQAIGGAYIPLGRAYGVNRVVLPESADLSPGDDAKSWIIDLTGFSGSIEEELGRRDFTINAMSLPVGSWLSPDWRQEVVDPFSGRNDLARRSIRVVHPAVFQEDPGRLLRAVRLATLLRLRLEPDTSRLIRAEAPRITRVSGERVRDEFLAILAADGARSSLEILDRLDLLCRIIPELALTKGVEQPKEHYWEVWGHLLHTVEKAELVTRGHQHSAIYSLAPWTAEATAYFNQPASDGQTRRTLLKLAALLHDIAKPQTKKPDDTGRIRFLGHAELGAELAAARLQALRLSSHGIAMIATMVEHHLRPAQMGQGQDPPTRRAIYRYFRDLGEVAMDCLYLSLADYLAARGPLLVHSDWARHATMVGFILRAGTQPSVSSKGERLVTGHDLMEHLGLSPGPQVGSLLEKISEARASGEVNTREQALSLAAQLLASR